jgi:hypothetical protein
MKTSLLFIIFISLFICGIAQENNIYDNFSKKDLTGWSSSGVEFKYSFSYDNAENGYAEINTATSHKPNSYIGKITRNVSFLFTAGNFINLMLKGVNNDVNVRIALLYDIDHNGKYNDDEDIILISKPISLNFNDWKEVKIKLNEENFNLVSKHNDDFTVTEQEILAFQLEFETGKNYKSSKFESGIALISEIINKENLVNNENLNNSSKDKESYFSAKNYPNPFNPTTTISYTLKNSTHVTLTVYDRLGREVKVLVDDTKSEGTHTVDFNGSELPSGIYFYRIKTPEKTEVRKMILAK